MSPPRERAHLNLVDSSRQLFELDPEATIEAEEGWLFGAGRSSHPAISNGAFRRNDEVEPAEFIDRATGFFRPLGRSFSIWARTDDDADDELVASAEAAGMQPIFSMPEMTLDTPAPERPLPAGVELRRVAGKKDADAYWAVAASAYASIGFPPEVFRFYENEQGLREDNVVTFIAYLDGEAVAIAMTIVSHGVAGVYWVGCLNQARGRGLGRAVTVAATNAGFELGADIASLQASVMGEPIYKEIGYRRIFDYRLLMANPSATV